ncbi:MAG: AI-2E family transporter [Bacteroidales bacterium]|nr:AI-2E family transporter [Bacteroidales bacterium]
MGKLKYIIPSVIVVAIIFILWKIFLYILIAAVFSLILSPLNESLKKIRLYKYTLPSGLRSLLCVLLFWFTFFILFYFLLPVIFNEFYELTKIRPEVINQKIHPLTEAINRLLIKFSIIKQSEDINEIITNNIIRLINLGNVGVIFNNLFGFIKSFILFIFISSFIMFFFLKDANLFQKLIMMLVPTKYQTETKYALLKINKTLLKYFSGVMIDLICVFLLINIGMTIVGIELQKAILLGLVSAIMNVIPYIGPIISYAFGISVGVINNINFDFNTVILPLIIKMSIVYIITNIIDAVIFQPFIYSKTLKAHPLEIFLIIISAGTIGGIIGMMVALPSYMTVRIIASTFFNQFYLVKNLTKGL